MNNNQRKKYRAGTLVFVEDIEVLRKSFSSWPKCQVFKVSKDVVSNNKKRYVWVDSNSIGLEPKYVRLTTKEERAEYKKHLKKKRFIYGY